VKKLAIGCLVICVVLGIVGTIGTYYVYRVVKTKVMDTIDQFAAFKDVPSLERQVRNKTEFNPPESGLLTQSQVERLAAVQTAVRNTLGTGAHEMEVRYKALLDKKEATALDAPELISAYRDLAKLWLAGKKAQVDALNQAGFSLAEYRWVRDRTYRAVGVPLASVDIAEIIEKAVNGGTIQEPAMNVEGSIGPSGPAENQKLIERFKKTFEDNAPLAVFGL
jgi:hypothetical protein